MSKPSAFIDSPEDLIAKSRRMIEEEEGLAPKTAILIRDLGLELEKERGGRASHFEMIKAANVTASLLEAERDALKRRVVELESGKDRLTLQVEVGRMRRLVFALATIVFALLWGLAFYAARPS